MVRGMRRGIRNAEAVVHTTLAQGASRQEELGGAEGGQGFLEMGVGRTGTVEWRRSARGKFQAEGLALAHLGNTPVFKEER